MPQHDRQRRRQGSELDEQEFAWWAKQLGHEPNLPEVDLGQQPAGDAHENEPEGQAIDLSASFGVSARAAARVTDVLREADEAAAEEQRERAGQSQGSGSQDNGSSPAAASPSNELVEALDELTTRVDSWARGYEARPSVRHQPTMLTAEAGPERFASGFHQLLHSPYHPYATIRRYTAFGLLLCACGAAIAWLVALLVG